ncbi:hypothetical protein SUGI_0129880 [Cryptomeria japonica]|nr:hypothetical protein SUGI_0129880 [Cryptomeria japonica]
MVDVESSDIFHSTLSRILVDLDISNGLPFEILLNSSKGSWVQSLDYEEIPFCCRRCFKTGHVVENCGFENKATKASWWKGASVQHYMVSKLLDQPKSFFEVVALEPQDPRASPLVVSLGRAIETIHVFPNVFRVKETQAASSGDIDLASTPIFTKSVLAC